MDSSASPPIQAALKKHISYLCETIGPRDFSQLNRLKKVQDYIENYLSPWQPKRQQYEINESPYTNLIYQLNNQSTQRPLVIGAHYDTVAHTPGADDNSSAVAVLLEVARQVQHIPLHIPIELVFFTLEEPPFFYTAEMGSMVYAQNLQKKNTEIEGMICLEMLGYYSMEKNSQNYPNNLMRFFYPDTGNFIAIVSNYSSRDLMDKLKNNLSSRLKFPVETLNSYNLPLPGIELSDHSSFWRHGYKAVMLTDTAFYRNPHYHKESDRPETLNFDNMAQIVSGLVETLQQWQ